MYPSFEIFGQPVFVFGITIVICFFLFLWMLKKLSIRFGYEYSFFMNSIGWYFLSVFIFSRLFYVISMWKDMKHIDGFFSFFITSDYNFSLMGAIFGFFVVLYLNTRIFKKSMYKYIDGVVLSFLFISIIGFLGSFLGGQVYGRITSFGIEVPYEYSGGGTISPGELFPLPLIYAGLFFLLFSVLYIISMYTKLRGITGYLGLGIFAAIILGLEFFTGKIDVFKDSIDINLSQISAIALIFFSIYGLFKRMKK